MRAPHIETTSFGSSTGAVTPRATDAEVGEDAIAASPPPLFAAATPVSVRGALVAKAPRSITSGGGAGLDSRPMIHAAQVIANTPASGTTRVACRSRVAHFGQKRRLVHGSQRARRMRSPQSTQKLGLYMTGVLAGDAAGRIAREYTAPSAPQHKPPAPHRFPERARETRKPDRPAARPRRVEHATGTPDVPRRALSGGRAIVLRQ